MCKLQETDLTMFTCTCIGAKLTFTATDSSDMTELQTRWSYYVETLKKRSGAKDCMWNVHLVRNKLAT